MSGRRNSLLMPPSTFLQRMKQLDEVASSSSSQLSVINSLHNSTNSDLNNLSNQTSNDDHHRLRGSLVVNNSHVEEEDDKQLSLKEDNRKDLDRSYDLTRSSQYFEESLDFDRPHNDEINSRYEENNQMVVEQMATKKSTSRHRVVIDEAKKYINKVDVFVNQYVALVKKDSFKLLRHSLSMLILVFSLIFFLLAVLQNEDFFHVFSTFVFEDNPTNNVRAN